MYSMQTNKLKSHYDLPNSKIRIGFCRHLSSSSLSKPLWSLIGVNHGVSEFISRTGWIPLAPDLDLTGFCVLVPDLISRMKAKIWTQIQNE